MARPCFPLMLALLIMSTVGCSTIEGPRKNRDKPKPDLPSLSIEEQKRRGRDKYAYEQDDFRTGPPLYIDRPSPTGR